MEWGKGGKVCIYWYRVLILVLLSFGILVLHYIVGERDNFHQNRN